MSSGDHHHFVYIRGESEVEVHLPIAPQVEQGEIDVVIELNTQIMSSEQTVTIKILPEGSIVHRHTSALLDLKSRANVLRFMNIIVDETPIIPYEVKKTFRGRFLIEVTNFYQFLIARSIQLENGGFSSSSTECKNLLYLLDMSSKVYKMNFLDKIDKKKMIK